MTPHEIAEFDWSNAVEKKRKVKIETSLGNSIVGTVMSYQIFRPSPLVKNANRVVIKGVCTSHPKVLRYYVCDPWSIKFLRQQN